MKILSSIVGGTFAVGAALLFWLGDADSTSALQGLLNPPSPDGAFQRGFRSDAMAKVNRLRSSMGVDEVKGDEALQSFLADWFSTLSHPEDVSLDDVFDRLQNQFPGAQYLAANLITSRDRENLLGKVTGWTAATNPDFDSINTTVFRSRRLLGVLAVMSRRIPEFSLSALNDHGGRFHNRCPHCHKIHALELEKDSRTLILSCPHCDLPFDILAVGTTGKMRRATDFFEGFIPPGGFPTEGSDEEHILAIWQKMAGHCRYELDQDRKVEGQPQVCELWKTSDETWSEAAGDCEDTSILLADMLCTAGFDARVAIGWNGNIGQHAWTVVQTGSKQYLLETTLQREIALSDLVEVASVADFYHPEQVFDRQSIYYTTARPDRFGRDYFSPKIWKRVPMKQAEMQDSLTQR